MDWLAFAGSILGGLIGGLFTFVGVHLTIKHEDKKKRQECLEKANIEKPRLEIVSFKDFKATSRIKNSNSDCNVLVLGILGFKDIDGRAHIFYDENTLDKEKLVFVEYEFVNSGLTEIKEICVTGNSIRFMAIVECERKETYINNHLLNNDVWLNKRYIKPKGIFKLRVYYASNQPLTAMSRLTIWLEDVKGFVWSQTLNAPNNEIEISIMNSSENLRNAIDVKPALDCFRHPELW